MFGPNRHITLNFDLDYAHREERFFAVYDEVVVRFRSLFGLDDSWALVLVTGSGTAAIEAVMASYLGAFRIIGTTGTFHDRWVRLARHYRRLDDAGDPFMVQLETSRSLVNKPEASGLLFVDAISAFPYYDLPAETSVFITCSSKILGAAPVLGIIGFKKNLAQRFLPADEFTYFNLNRLWAYGQEHQTPHTPAMPLFKDLADKLAGFDLGETRRCIDHHCALLVEAYGAENFSGEHTCPVLTFREPERLPEWLLDKYSLYGRFPFQGARRNIQVFTYSEETAAYESLARDLRRLRN